MRNGENGVHHALGGIQRALSRSRFVVGAAIKARNQANMVIGYYLAPSGHLVDSGECALIGLLAPVCRTFIDVGANVGDWTGRLLHAAPAAQGLLFDPSREAIARLRMRFQSVPNVEIVAAAVGDQPGVMPFYEGPGADVFSSLIASHSHDATQHGVPVTTIDLELEKRGWQAVDFLKIDAEGYDAKVLQGASGAIGGHRIRVIQFEYNTPWAMAGDTLGKVLANLEGQGYLVYLIRPGGLYSLDYGRYREYFSCSNYLAVRSEDSSIVADLVKGPI